jgi:hypothetical protein
MVHRASTDALLKADEQLDDGLDREEVEGISEDEALRRRIEDSRYDQG